MTVQSIAKRSSQVTKTLLVSTQQEYFIHLSSHGVLYIKGMVVKVNSRSFQVLEILVKIQDFPGGVGTLRNVTERVTLEVALHEMLRHNIMCCYWVIWYWLKGGDALWLWRQPWVSWKVMAAYRLISPVGRLYSIEISSGTSQYQYGNLPLTSLYLLPVLQLWM